MNKKTNEKKDIYLKKFVGFFIFEYNFNLKKN